VARGRDRGDDVPEAMSERNEGEEGQVEGHLPVRDSFRVCLGPGPLLDELGPLLAHLAGHPGRVSRLADVAELLSSAGLGDGGRLLLAGDGFPEEDIGFVRRFLAAHPAWELVVLGRDPGTRVARVLLALSRARWLGTPPDLDQLRELARAPRPPVPPAPSPASRRAEIESPAASAPAALGDYVGPLADLVQRVDLSLDLARAEPAAEGQPSPAEEVDDLRQMTRMMKRVAAPPAVGGEVFDVGELFEEQLASVAIKSPRQLRFLPKGERGHRVQADRAALSEAIASLLLLARGCAAPDGVVRAPYGSIGADSVLLALEFPEGPLAGSDVRELLRPGGLADRVPGLGAADLPAALAVARSQGGDLRLERGPAGLRAELLLPLAAAPWPAGNGS
jgi:hypothetical protein